MNLTKALNIITDSIDNGYTAHFNFYSSDDFNFTSEIKELCIDSENGYIHINDSDMINIAKCSHHRILEDENGTSFIFCVGDNNLEIVIHNYFTND